MKQVWTQWSAKVDALTLRERVIVFVSILACLVGATDLLWLSPAQAQFKLAQQRFATQAAELARLRNELAQIGTVVDPNQAVRESTAGVEAEIATVNQDIAAQLTTAGAGRALEPVLVQFLRRQGNLTLLATRTLQADATAGAKVPGLTRQGLELQIAGAYPDLVRYVQSLETALPYLRWSSLHLQADKQPAQMRLQVYVLGATP